ncbi:39S ribosomal protein L21, mitochondrial [Harpegnathos saltator]|uniref:Large ribosomal subunit protein bL21m n=1 Tax=Harpegnathos saltator TaxID=610380 RepID=E2BNE8_HARSA|nr:39S ribosomal protein L21, mitochondrial [Harpegnathos saltator]EFN82727.1 39S ribosomal protein L21, mitochondrial [Harpegnathos saltator]
MTTLLGFSKLFNYTASNCLKRVGPAAIFKQLYPALRLWEIPIVEYRKVVPAKDRRYYLQPRTKWMKPLPDQETEIQEWDDEKEQICSDVTNEINNLITTNRTGRMFAVIQICGKQYKVTENDIIVIQGFWPPNIGERMKLEKVLLVGSTDFTLVGRPILNRELVSVDVTVIEKTLSHTITRFRFMPRKKYRRINFYKVQHTMLRINSITVNGKIDEKKEVEGLDRVY